jgi:hypothetical protein
MTMDDRITVDVDALVAVWVQCTQCQTAISFATKDWTPPMALRCPGCAALLWAEGSGNAEVVRTLARALRGLRSMGTGDSFRIGFQLPSRRTDKTE